MQGQAGQTPAPAAPLELVARSGRGQSGPLCFTGAGPGRARPGAGTFAAVYLAEMLRVGAQTATASPCAPGRGRAATGPPRSHPSRSRFTQTRRFRRTQTPQLLPVSAPGPAPVPPPTTGTAGPAGRGRPLAAAGGALSVRASRGAVSSPPPLRERQTEGPACPQRGGASGFGLSAEHARSVTWWRCFLRWCVGRGGRTARRWREAAGARDGARRHQPRPPPGTGRGEPGVPGLSVSVCPL